MIIALSGTPGCGKTSVAKILKKKFAVIDLNRLVVRKKLYAGYDKKRKTWIADIDKVEKFIKNEIKKYGKKAVLIDSHLSHLLPASIIDIVIVLRCDPKELEKRLKKKKWSNEKIRENVEAEIIGLISWEAKQRHKNVFEIDTTGRTAEQVAQKLLKGLISNNKKHIEWLK